ncbi:hypothetical protein FHP05_05745 [Cerasibacillus terrae]|uniref:Uncharacterized protein n=1 Tax=Cerasibacillus terrae TaxID=2498845 RepID=A0A5C8NWM4_9BACI|nr:hypothetical protein [Cerasibacillus terrae]TXL65627.1 hypothetical protein FHP05_05745 [Cerasibacillus terrae]
MNRPIILDNAICRIGEDTKKFNYDYSLDMNVVKGGPTINLFIDLNRNTNEMVTKTKVERERDDEDFYYSELFTKTEVKRERDDEESLLLELETKTFVERERDDESLNYNK